LNELQRVLLKLGEIEFQVGLKKLGKEYKMSPINSNEYLISFGGQESLWGAMNDGRIAQQTAGQPVVLPRFCFYDLKFLGDTLSQSLHISTKPLSSNSIYGFIN